jgi:hypothetical protein
MGVPLLNGPAHRYGIALTTTFAVLAGILLYVGSRNRAPVWKTYQERGIALSIERLEKELAEIPAADASSGEKRSVILERLKSLRAMRPAVIEVGPFDGKLGPERCLTCHFGIEDISASHPNSVFGCVVCHGGNGPDLTVAGAHRNLRGGRNPARLDLAAESCGSRGSIAGRCHSRRKDGLLDRVDNVPRSLMATNAGIIGILRFQWGMTADSSPRFGVRRVSDGKTRLDEIPGERTARGDVDLASSHFRKFCAACHLWAPRRRAKMGRLRGCPACHARYASDGKYHGADPTIDREEVGHAATHTITNRIPDERCRACHNRSARIGLNYHGEMESAQYGTPFVRGGLNDYTISGGRFVLRLIPDIHHEKGMGCIDCHTGQDTMGDGRLYGRMQDQAEIRCEDCHGSRTTPPKTMKVRRNDPLVQTLIRSAPFVKLSDGDEIAVTSRGRPMPHVRRTAKGFRLTSKLTGKEHPVRVITGKRNAHRIKGHDRLECDSCHSAWSPQCYGCHQILDFGRRGRDHMTGKTTPGRWAEGRGYFRSAKNIYGINPRGKVGILVPGCQVWNTVADSSGKVIPPYDSMIMRLRNGLTSIAAGATHPHTTRTPVPRCIDCHLDPKALGLGEGRLTRNPRTGDYEFRPIYDSQASGLKIDFPLEAVVTTEGKQLQSTSRKLVRPFNREELRRITAIAPCLPCHDRYDDPVWLRPPPYVLMPPCRQALENSEEG